MMRQPTFVSRAYHFSSSHNKASSSSISKLLVLGNHDIASLSSNLQQNGYAKTSNPILSHQATEMIKAEMPKLFRGEFDTGTYPDEWHWREGISLPNAAREMCNSWKSSRLISSIVLNEDLGKLIAQVMGWESVRIAQNDLVWKPPSSNTAQRIDTVGFHQDSAYISSQFEPYENNSVTLWMALDDADEETGCVEYASGSHKWRPLLNGKNQEDNNDIPEKAIDTMSAFHASDAVTYRGCLDRAAKLAAVTNPYDTIESAPTKEGHAILHHQDIWHGSGPNRSAVKHRRALVAHYIRGDVTFQSC